MTMCLHEWMIFWLLLRMEELIINSFTHAGSSQKKPTMRTIASSQTACTQIKRARTLMSAAKWPPHLACCLCHPCWRKAVTWLRLTKSNASSHFSARGRTNLELREKFILPEGGPQGLTTFRSRGRRSKPGSRNASPTRSSSSASHSGASLPSAPSAPTTPTASASSRVSWGRIQCCRTVKNKKKQKHSYETIINFFWLSNNFKISKLQDCY